jgi:hypothetical protein
MVNIGLISYPLYLWHWPLLSFARIVESGPVAQEMRLVLIALAFLLAWLTYRFIEKPVRFGRAYKAKIPLLSFLMIVIGLAGLIIDKNEGFTQRATIKHFQGNYNELLRTTERDEACKSYLKSEEFLFHYCRYNDAGGKETIALIGDSHAHTAFPGLAEALAVQNKNLLMLANSSCPPLSGAVTGINEIERESCAARIDQMIKTVIDKKEIKTVILMTRGAVYISGAEFRQNDSRQMFYSSNPANTTPPEKIFASALQATADILRESGKKVYYVLEWPELGLDPAACLSRPFRRNARDCGPALEDVRARQAKFREIVASTNGIKTIDPLPLFCPDGRCQVFKDGTLLYADDDHISVEGSRFLARLIMNGLSAP